MNATRHPREEIELPSSAVCKFSNVLLVTEKFGSKLDCRNSKSARIVASWSGDDGLIDTSVPTRSGTVNLYIVQTVKINGEFHQHAFAVVWWYKTDCDLGHFGKPSHVWKLHAYEPCRPSLFMPVQSIGQKFACCSVELNGVDKLIVNPIPRSFH